MKLAWVALILGIAIAALSPRAAIAGVRGDTELGVIVEVLLFPLGAAVAVVGYLAARADAREKAAITAAAEAENGTLQVLANLQRQSLFQRMPPASGCGPEDS